MSTYLMHHGIKGQKWGVRRFQNEDGSYKSGAEGRYDPESNGSSRAQKLAKKKSLYEYRATHTITGRKRYSEKWKNKANKVSEKLNKYNESKSTKKSKMSPEKKKALAKKIAIGVGATAAAAAAAYVISRNIKNRANEKLLQEYSTRVSSIMRSHDSAVDNVVRGVGTNTSLTNRVLDHTRQHTNSILAGAQRAYDDQHYKNRNVINAYKYLKGRR